MEEDETETKEINFWEPWTDAERTDETPQEEEAEEEFEEPEVDNEVSWW